MVVLVGGGKDDGCVMSLDGSEGSPRLHVHPPAPETPITSGQRQRSRRPGRWGARLPIGSRPSPKTVETRAGRRPVHGGLGCR